MRHIGLNTGRRKMTSTSDYRTAEAKVRAAARVTLTIDIAVPDSWGTECTVAQVQQQAKESALGILRRMKANQPADYQIVGEPIVRAILVEEQR